MGTAKLFPGFVFQLESNLIFISQWFSSFRMITPKRPGVGLPSPIPQFPKGLTFSAKLCGLETCPSQHTVGIDPKPQVHLVHPGCMQWGEMKVKALAVALVERLPHFLLGSVPFQIIPN